MNKPDVYIKQNDPGMYDEIAHIGCFWRVGMKIAEEISQQRFSRAEELNALWAESAAQGLMVDSGSGMELHRGVVPIIHRGLDYFDCPKRVWEIGLFKQGEMQYYGFYKDQMPAPGKRWYVQKIALGPGHVEPYHYREVDKYGKLRFDPYHPALKPHGIEYSIIIEEIV